MFVKATLSEAEISGTANEFNQIAEKIQNLGQTHRFSIKSEENINSWPYDFFIKIVELQIEAGPVLVKSDNSVLKIIGGNEEMNAFASFFNFDSDSQAGEHHHYEYFEGNEYIHKDSMAVVIKLVCNGK